MGNFKRRDSGDRGPKSFSGGKKFGGRSFGGGNKYDDSDFGRGPSLHHATCHSCGKDCEVPFRPNGRKPVFCSICFDKQGGSSAPKFGGKSFAGSRFENDRKPDFHRGSPMAENKSIEQLKAQFDQLDAKLDKILQILSAPAFISTSNEPTEAVALEESTQKPSFKMKKKVSGVKKTKKKKQ